jgi:D-glycero-alpha-D-manno-heptose 1-phosphate guanylyltransferase
VLDALILAGGFGKRLQSVLGDRPKPMAEVAGRPFLEWLLLALRQQGVTRFILCTGYKSEIVAFFQDGKRWDVEVIYSCDPTPLGTGGAIRHALPSVQSSRFLVMNGDSFSPFQLDSLDQNHRQHQASSTIWLVPVEDCSRYGAVEVSSTGAVEAFREKPAQKEPGLINAGLYLMERESVEGFIPEGQPASLETDLFPSLIGKGLYAVAGEGPFLDIGLPEDLRQADKRFAWEALV